MSSLDPDQGAFSHRNLGNLRNGRREREERKKGRRRQRRTEKAREKTARTSVSHHLKRESQQLRKAHWTERKHTHIHRHTQTGGVVLFSRCPALSHSGKLQREERVCVYTKRWWWWRTTKDLRNKKREMEKWRKERCGVIKERRMSVRSDKRTDVRTSSSTHDATWSVGTCTWLQDFFIFQGKQVQFKTF